MSAAPLLEGRDLASRREDRLLFSDLSCTLAAGEALEVSGPNGSGKTTLLRVLCGLRPADAGTVLWRGQPVEPDPWTFRSELTWVGHENGLKNDLTARENLEVDRRLGASGEGLAPGRALEVVGLGGRTDLPVRVLSAGQRRRLALARLLVRGTVLWMLDEPFTALDRDGTVLVGALVGDHLRAGGGVIFTSHHPVELPAGAHRRLDLAG